MADNSDTVKRIRTALWIYASIAISKLSAWSDFWGTATKTYPLMTKRMILEGLGNGEEKFNDSLEKAIRAAMVSMKKMNQMERTLNDFRSGGSKMSDVLPPQRQQEFMRKFLVPGVHEDIVITYDKFATGGLFTAESEEKQLRAATARFQTLCSIDWRSCFHEHDNNQYPIRWIAQKFLKLSTWRHMQIEHFRSWQSVIEDDDEKNPDSIYLEDSIRRFIDSSQISMENEDEDEDSVIQKLKYSLRVGKRWNDIAELLGAEEVVLIGGMHDGPPQHVPNTTLNITAIIQYGTAEEFEKLKHLLRTEFPWLKDICSQLRGILPLIMELESLLDTDRLRVSSLADLIQKACLKVFGENARLNAIEAIEQLLVWRRLSEENGDHHCSHPE